MIKSMEELYKLLKDKEFGMISGGFDPVHKGHVQYILAAAKLTPCLVAVVNGDSFLMRKKGFKFMDAEERSYIVDNIKGIDYTVIYNSDNDTVNEIIQYLKPSCFLKGGDRTSRENIPEWETCEKIGCKIITGVGGNKSQSSSELVKKFKKH
jgi:cytidyltransferase-like protein